ncbi:hypothetical protein HERIO_1386 [Hepatospora eriocheir]|uniref:Uncharacterized protein n=1 Tax=Hepatospora eriocheir TaxID=1081669 RepID=A0A1X0QA92_9MICR|nr:hypothetical protein HERIO_1386 [Hepatospora eriocheir]
MKINEYLRQSIIRLFELRVEDINTCIEVVKKDKTTFLKAIEVVFKYAPESSIVISKLIKRLKNELPDLHDSTLKILEKEEFESDIIKSKEIFKNVLNNNLNVLPESQFIISNIFNNFQFNNYMIVKRCAFIESKEIIKYLKTFLSHDNLLVVVKLFENNTNFFNELYLNYKEFTDKNLVKMLISLIFNSYEYSEIEDEMFGEMFDVVGCDFIKKIGDDKIKRCGIAYTEYTPEIDLSNVYTDPNYSGEFKFDDFIQIASKSPEHALFYLEKYNIPNKEVVYLKLKELCGERFYEIITK